MEQAQQPPFDPASVPPFESSPNFPKNQPTASQWTDPVGLPTDSPNFQPHRGRRWRLWLLVIGIIVVGLGIWGYLAWSRGFLRLPFFRQASAKVVDRMITSLGDIKNAQYSLRFQLTTEPRKSGAKPFFPETNNTNQTNGNINASRVGVSDDDVLISNARQYVLAAASYADSHENSYPPCPNSSDSCDPATVPGLIEFFLNSTPPNLPTGYDPFVYRVVAANGNATGSFELSFSIKVGTIGYAAGPCTASPFFGEGGGSGVFNCTEVKSDANANLNTNSFQIEEVGGQVGLGSVSSVFPGGLEMDSLFQAVPADITVDSGVTVALQTDRTLKDADGFIRLDGTYSGGDSSIALDVEARKIDENFYFLVSKFPSLFFFDLSGIKEKWIKLPPGDTQWYDTSDSLERVNMKGAIEDLQRVLRAIFQNDFLDVDKTLAPETIKGVRSEHYRIKANLDRLPDVYRALIEDQRSRNESVTGLEADLKKLDDPQVRQTLERINENTTFDVWIDGAHGYLRQLRWMLALVPPDSIEKLRDKQVTTTLMLTLENVNETTRVETPTKTIDLDEATRLVTGITKEEQVFNKQKDRVSKIRSALRNYQSGLYGVLDPAPKQYPEKLQDMVTAFDNAKSRCLAKRAESNTNADSRLGSRCNAYDYAMVREADLIDIYTGQPFGYARDGENYKLTYTMHPPTEESTMVYGVNGYVDGMNTATSEDLSLEKEGDQSPMVDPIIDPDYYNDTDKDGLANYLEKKIGTDPLKVDSDGDGYTDEQEYNGGYDPLGAGKQNEGAWSACVNLSTTQSTCRGYCTTIGKHCWDAGTTTSGAANQGAETWSSGEACSAGETTTKYNSCDFTSSATDARWKCFCK